jgi:AbrB family looped-hinge helix DNA binding protein
MKRKGQVTIPQELRTEFGLDEGAYMDINKENNKIVITPLPPLEPYEPVGEEEQKKLFEELETLRRRWR